MSFVPTLDAGAPSRPRLSRTLDPVEVRVLGSLMEKQLSTPEYYPLTLNALLAACNQKSNREPVMELAEADLQSRSTGAEDEAGVEGDGRTRGPLRSQSRRRSAASESGEGPSHASSFFAALRPRESCVVAASAFIASRAPTRWTRCFATLSRIANLWFVNSRAVRGRRKNDGLILPGARSWTARR